MKLKINTFLPPKIFSPILFTLFLLPAVSSFAQERENVTDTPSGEGEFVEWDLNSDGYMNPGEFDSFVGDVGLYGDWDRNYDGVYDDDELYTGFLNDWDANEDGLISEEEYASGSTEWEKEYGDNFDDWDTDDSNFLDIEEYALAMNKTGVFAGWDADQDGAYNETELHNGIFETYDRDGDGFINAEEFNEADLTPDVEE